MTELIAILADLAGVAEPMVLGWFLIFVRVGAAVALLPAFGDQMVPQRVKLGVALAFSVVVAPPVIDRIPNESLGTLTPLLSEAAVGLMLGIGLRFFIFALQIAGMVIAQATSLAQLFGIAGEPQPVIANILTLAALAVAVAAGLHVRAAEMMILSYDLFPPGSILPAPDLLQWGLHQAGRATGLALSLAAPFVIGSLLYNVALGVINRAMPQLMVAFVGAPALTLGGIALFALAAPLMLTVWMQALDAYLADPTGVAR